MVWDHEVAGSNPAIPTMGIIGGLAERSNASVLKTDLRVIVTGVRIPKPPLKTVIYNIL
jgi:hypothetical protein